MTNPPSLACEAGILIHILQARNRGSEKLKGLPTPANLHWQDCGQAHFRRVNIHQLLESSWRVEAGSEPGFPDQIPLFSFTHRCLSMGNIKYHLPHFSYFMVILSSIQKQNLKNTAQLIIAQCLMVDDSTLIEMLCGFLKIWSYPRR